MKEYKLSSFSGFVVRVSDGAVIPFDNDNSDYKLYLKWLNDGNTPLPADEQPQG